MKLNNGTVVRRHVDHVKSRKSTVDNFDITETEEDFYDSHRVISIDEPLNSVKLWRSSCLRRQPQRYGDDSST